MCLLINPALCRQRQVSSWSSLANSPSTNQSLPAPVKDTVFRAQCASFLSIFKWVIRCHTNSTTYHKVHQNISVVAFKFPSKLYMYLRFYGMSVDSSGWEMGWKELVPSGFGVLWNTLTREIVPMVRAEMLALEWSRTQPGSPTANDWWSWQRLTHVIWAAPRWQKGCKNGRCLSGVLIREFSMWLQNHRQRAGLKMEVYLSIEILKLVRRLPWCHR